MSRVNTMFQCPLCKGKTKIDFKKPNLITPTVLRPTCSDCESKFLLRIKKTKGVSRQVHIDILEVHASEQGEQLAALLMQKQLIEKQKQAEGQANESK